MRFPSFPSFGSPFGSRKGPTRVPLAAGRTMLAVYAAPAAAPDAESLRSVVLAGLPAMAEGPLAEAIALYAEQMLMLACEPRGACPEVPMDYVRLFRLGEQEEESLRRATHVLLVGGMDVPGGPPFGFWCALAAARILARHFGGVILETDVARILPLAQYGDPLPADGVPRPAELLVVPQSVDPRTGLGWITTKGMGHFGLPEVQIENVPANLIEPLGGVINGLCLALLRETARQARAFDGPLRTLELPPEFRVSYRDTLEAYAPAPETAEPPAGARGWTLVRLRFDRGRRGADSFLTMLPPARFAGSHGEWLNTVLGDLFAPGDPVVEVPGDSERMEAAHLEAVSGLPAVRERFQDGLEPGAQLYVKHGFPYGDGSRREYMWVVVATWGRGRIRGHLANDPVYRMDLRGGQVIELGEGEVFDWLLLHPDGRQEGGYTQAVALD